MGHGAALSTKRAAKFDDKGGATVRSSPKGAPKARQKDNFFHFEDLCTLTMTRSPGEDILEAEVDPPYAARVLLSASR